MSLGHSEQPLGLVQPLNAARRPGDGAHLQSMRSTAELSRRPARAPDHEAENRALIALARDLAISPEGILQKLVDTALVLCRAHSAGISLLEDGDHRSNFHWRAIAGAWAPQLNGGTPRNFGPCGTVLDRNLALMCSHPERDFPYFGAVLPLLDEGLLVPFYVKGEAVGTIWVVAHDESRRFDAEDLRVLTNLGTFASAAYQAWLAAEAAAKAQREVQQSLSALRDSEHRLHAVLDALPAAVYTTDADGRVTYYNQAAVELSGRRPELGSDEWCVTWRLFSADGTPMRHDECPMAQALKQDRPIRGIEAVAERPDGTRVPFVPYPTPLHDASGKLIGAVNMLVDVSERSRHDEIAQRLAAIVASSDDAIVSKNLDRIITSWNKGAERLFGYTAEEVIGKPIGILIPADRQEEEDSIIDRIRRGQRVEHYETVRQRKDGSLVEISLTVSPVRNARGEVVGASKIARDITARKKTEEQIALLAREAEHRAKNVLATVQATVQLTQADTPEALKQAIAGRIQALANVHRLFIQSRWMGADLHSVVSQELSPYCQEGDARARIDGPSLLLEPNSAQTIAVTLHELATNAAKYGALSVPTGKVEVEWSRAADGRIVLRWIETGGPRVKPLTRRGFGMRVMESMIREQLNGEVRFDWRAEGLACEMIIPAGNP
jgi:PAS domain S-box-containing protein